MALKDWQQIVYTDNNLVWDTIPYKGRISLLKLDGGSWDAYVVVNKNKDFHKDFKTKSQALAFAKKYMRSH